MSYCRCSHHCCSYADAEGMSVKVTTNKGESVSLSLFTVLHNLVISSSSRPTLDDPCPFLSSLNTSGHCE